MTHAFSFRVAQVGYQFAGSVRHIGHSLRIIMDKCAVVCINRTMLCKDTSPGTMTGSHVRMQSLIFEMLPIIVTTVILMGLFSTEHGGGKFFIRRIQATTCQGSAFCLPCVWYLQTIKQMGIITNYFRVGDTASTPLVRGAELIPVAYTLRYIPFKEITVWSILLVDIDFIS